MQLTQAFTKSFPQLSITCDSVLGPRMLTLNLNRALRAKSQAKEDMVKGIVDSGDGKLMKKDYTWGCIMLRFPQSWPSPIGSIDNSTECPISKLGVATIRPINKIISRQNCKIIQFKSCVYYNHSPLPQLNHKNHTFVAWIAWTFLQHPNLCHSYVTQFNPHLFNEWSQVWLFGSPCSLLI